jgi:hypothetical protein
MASGDVLAVFNATNVIGPTTLFATPDTFVSADSPTQIHVVLDFDTGTVEYADFMFVMPQNYTASANLSCFIGWTCNTAGGADGVVWSVAFKPITDDVDDLDTVTFGTTQDFAESVPASLGGEMQYASKTGITFAAAGSPLAGEVVYVRIRRQTADSNDTLNEDAELHFVEIREA